jgi:hypothetical protein
VNTVDDAQLDQLRLQGDPLADQVVERLFEAGEVAAVSDLMTVLVRNDGLPPELLPAVVREYLDKSDDGPPIDLQRVERGERVFAEFGPEILMVLGFYSLPSAYAARKGVQVLYRTGYLSHRPVRRVFETTQMVVDVMRPGGLKPRGSGIRSAQKVRLVHAAVRHLLRTDTRQPWPAEYGFPINQEDMAGTLMTFSFIVLDGLAKLNIPLSTEQREDYLYAWVIVGRLMGVREELLPSNLQQAEALTRRIYSRQIAASSEGQLMTKALLEGMQQLVPGSWLDGIPVALTRHFLRQDPFGGLDVAELLGVPRANWTRYLVSAMVWAAGVLAALGFERNLAHRRMRKVSVRFIQGMLLVERGGQRTSFELPEWLGEQWGVPRPAR